LQVAICIYQFYRMRSTQNDQDHIFKTRQRIERLLLFFLDIRLLFLVYF